VNVLAHQAGAEVVVVDVGVASPVDGALDRNVRRGTADLSLGAAMTDREARVAFAAGAAVARDAAADVLLTGDMGIGNTTPSAAVIAALTDRPAAAVTGRGTGIDDERLRRKTEIVAAAADRVRGQPPMRVLAEVGGLEIAAIAGFVTEGVRLRVPVIVDGVIALAGLAVAAALDPEVTTGIIAGHRSPEPGATAVLVHLDLEPVLDLQLRLGEGTGALLALPIVRSAAAILRDMATIDDVMG
jgi:nicotinate-nucleotide--dimethylbenzimidazole phosphoribosyltransferase